MAVSVTSATGPELLLESAGLRRDLRPSRGSRRACAATSDNGAWHSNADIYAREQSWMVRCR